MAARIRSCTPSLCHGAVGGVCTAANFMPELITDVYNKYAAGDREGSLEAQFKLNPVRLSMDAASFPVAAKDMAVLRGRDVGVPYLPTLPTPGRPGQAGLHQDDDRGRAAVNGVNCF